MKDRVWSRSLVAVVAAIALGGGALAGGGCQKEPVIVVRFEPRDLATPTGSRTEAATPPRAEPPVGKRDSAVAPEARGAAEEQVPSTMTVCARDAECTTVAADCCGCQAGGRAAAIARRHQAAWEAMRSKRCGETMCIAALSHDPSCAKAVNCRSGECTLVEAGARAPRRVTP